MQPIYPFTAIVGQEQLKIALILSVIDTKLGGLLISGPRGCGKSTAARSLSSLVQDGGQFVNLPLGASEDRVIGTINAQAVLQSNEFTFAPGLLHQAHKGMLYMDEVNLLADHLVDVLLDASASGVNYVERDGLSHQHPAKFTLIGTMNPDEGELRPQILDRFGLSVHLAGPVSVQERMTITAQRLQFDNDPEHFCRQFDTEQQSLKAQIQQATDTKDSVTLPESVQTYIATLCHDAQVDGIRADITLTRAAIAYAAFKRQQVVGTVCVDAVKELVLNHRRNTPPTSNDSNNSNNSGHGGDNGPEGTPPSSDNTTQSGGQWGQMQPEHVGSASSDTFKDYKLSAKHPSLTTLKKKPKNLASQHQRLGQYQGRRTQFSGLDSSQIDWLQTILHYRQPDVTPPSPLSSTGRFSRLAYKRRATASSMLHILLVDTSSSSMSGDGLCNTKGLIQLIAHQAYIARQPLCVIRFGNDTVECLHSPMRPPKHYQPLLNKLTAGGGTPLRKALQHIKTLCDRWDRTQRFPERTLHVFTDGRTNDAIDDIHIDHPINVIDTENASVKLGRSRHIANTLDAHYTHISQYRH